MFLRSTIISLVILLIFTGCAAVQPAVAVGPDEVTALFNGSAVNVVRDAVMGREGTMILKAANGNGWVFVRITQDAMFQVATQGSPLNALEQANKNGGTVYGWRAAQDMVKFYKDNNFVRVVLPLSLSYAKALILLVENAMTTPLVVPAFPLTDMVPSDELY